MWTLCFRCVEHVDDGREPVEVQLPHLGQGDQGQGENWEWIQKKNFSASAKSIFFGKVHVSNVKPPPGDPGELLQQPDFPTSGEARPAEEAGGELEWERPLRDGA